MEHRLITGGNEFLPFARSCVAKLKKLGIPYADQSYEVDGASIKVRIQPGHEYIRIEGITPGNVMLVFSDEGLVPVPDSNNVDYKKYVYSTQAPDLKKINFAMSLPCLRRRTMTTSGPLFPTYIETLDYYVWGAYDKKLLFSEVRSVTDSIKWGHGGGDIGYVVETEKARNGTKTLSTRIVIGDGNGVVWDDPLGHWVGTHIITWDGNWTLSGVSGNVAVYAYNQGTQTTVYLPIPITGGEDAQEQTTDITRFSAEASDLDTDGKVEPPERKLNPTLFSLPPASAPRYVASAPSLKREDVDGLGYVQVYYRSYRVVSCCNTGFYFFDSGGALAYSTYANSAVSSYVHAPDTSRCMPGWGASLANPIYFDNFVMYLLLELRTSNNALRATFFASFLRTTGQLIGAMAYSKVAFAESGHPVLSDPLTPYKRVSFPGLPEGAYLVSMVRDELSSI